MIPVTFGAAGVPRVTDYAQRYDTNGVRTDAVAPDPLPPVAEMPLVLGDRLSTSYNAKDAGSEEELRRMHIDGWDASLAMALTGKRDHADATELVGTRLAAGGYVNPYDIIGGAHRPDIPLITTDVQPVP